MLCMAKGKFNMHIWDATLLIRKEDNLEYKMAPKGRITRK